MSEKELATAVRDAAHKLNQATSAAVDAGLRVEYQIVDTRQFQDQWERPLLTVTLSRPL